MTTYRERYTPTVVGVNASVAVTNNALGGFLCTTAGTITCTTTNDQGAAITIINAHPVTAGVYVPLPFRISANGGTFTTAGGASGTLGT